MTANPKTILTDRGTIYFIRERDLISNEVTPYVKIGLTELDRAASERRDDLKTSNPRELFVHHAVKVPCVTSVETALRYEFLLQNVNLEWHYFGANSPRKLEEAITLCEELGERFTGYVNTIDAARDLSQKKSTGVIVDPSEEAAHWWREFHIHHHVSSIGERARKTLSARAKELVAAGESAPTGVLVKPKVTSKFDEVGFKTRYPELHAQYSIQRLSGKFDVKGKLDMSELAGVDLVHRTEQALAEYQAALVDGSDDGYSSSYRKLLLLRQLTKFSELEKEIAVSHLKVICGESAGIKGICSWTRELSKPRLDRSALRELHPAEYEEFNVRTMGSVATLAAGIGELAGEIN